MTQGKTIQEIMAAMKEHGLSISPNYISVLRSKVPGGKRRRRRRKGAKAAAPVTATPSAGSGLRAAISFAKSVGGIKEAEKLISTLREIKDLLAVGEDVAKFEIPTNAASVFFDLFAPNLLQKKT